MTTELTAVRLAGYGAAVWLPFSREHLRLRVSSAQGQALAREDAEKMGEHWLENKRWLLDCPMWYMLDNGSFYPMARVDLNLHNVGALGESIKVRPHKHKSLAADGYLERVE